MIHLSNAKVRLLCVSTKHIREKMTNKQVACKEDKVTEEQKGGVTGKTCYSVFFYASYSFTLFVPLLLCHSVLSPSILVYIMSSSVTLYCKDNSKTEK